MSHDSDLLILIVEDDDEIAGLIARYLGENGFRTALARDGEDLDLAIERERPALVVLDVNLPGEDGLALCLRLRNRAGPPVIMVTARGEDVDRILGLEMGADDYLPKPFNPRELLARIRAVLRRVQAPVEEARPRVLRFAGWTIDRAARRLSDPDGTRVALTGAEFDLLCALCDHPGRVLSREQLLDLTQGPKTASQDRSVDIIVSRLRLKIERNPRDPQIVQTVRSSGYILAASVEALP